MSNVRDVIQGAKYACHKAEETRTRVEKIVVDVAPLEFKIRDNPEVCEDSTEFFLIDVFPN